LRTRPPVAGRAPSGVGTLPAPGGGEPPGAPPGVEGEGKTAGAGASDISSPYTNTYERSTRTYVRTYATNVRRERRPLRVRSGGWWPPAPPETTAMSSPVGRPRSLRAPLGPFSAPVRTQKKGGGLLGVPGLHRGPRGPHTRFEVSSAHHPPGYSAGRPTERPEQSAGSEGGSREPPWGASRRRGSEATEDPAGSVGGEASPKATMTI